MYWKKNHRSNWKLYCIIDDKVIKHRSPQKVAQFLFEAGVGVVQLRYKNQPSYKFVRIAKKIQRLANVYKKRLLINDRIDVAKACGAGGVHLGSGDFSIATARRLLNRHSIIGKTVHSTREARIAAKEKPNYISAGPIFHTPLKKHLAKRGINFIKKVKKIVPVPVLAIGGINKRNVKSLLQSGAGGICVTRAVFEAKSILKQMEAASH